jgi:hypothetical protein
MGCTEGDDDGANGRGAMCWLCSQVGPLRWGIGRSGVNIFLQMFEWMILEALESTVSLRSHFRVRPDRMSFESKSTWLFASSSFTTVSCSLAAALDSGV